MTGVRPAAIGASDGLRTAPASRGKSGASDDLFAGLLEIAGRASVAAVPNPDRRPSAQRPTPERPDPERSAPERRTVANTGCVVRFDRAVDTPTGDRAPDDATETPVAETGGSATGGATVAPDQHPSDAVAALAVGPSAAASVSAGDAGRSRSWSHSAGPEPADALSSLNRPLTGPLATLVGPPPAGTGPLAGFDTQGAAPGAVATTPGLPLAAAGLGANPETTLAVGPVSDVAAAPAEDATGTSDEPVPASDQPRAIGASEGAVLGDPLEKPTAEDSDAAPPEDPDAGGREAPAASTTAGSISDQGGDGAGDRNGGQDRRDTHREGTDRLPVGAAAATETRDSALRDAVAPTHVPATSGAAGTTSSATPSATPSTTPSSTSTSGLSALAGSAGVGRPAAGNAAGPTRRPAGSSSVAGQVLPVVERLVTRGDGTQRVTVKLAPEALGEVRIVLTLRQGEVHVRMTGSDAAQQALLQGQSDLHRLLAGAGATSSSVQVGDQAATFGQPPDSSGSHGGARQEPGSGAPGSASDQPGSDVRRDPSGHQQRDADRGDRGARAPHPPGNPTDRHPGARTVLQDPSWRHQRRLDVSV